MTLLCCSHDLLKLQIVLQNNLTPDQLFHCSGFLCMRNNLIWIDLSDHIAVPEFLHWELLTFGKEPSVPLAAPASSLPTFLSFPKLSVLSGHLGEKKGIKLLLKSCDVVVLWWLCTLPIQDLVQSFHCLCWGREVCASPLAFSQLGGDYWSATLMFEFWGLLLVENFPKKCCVSVYFVEFSFLFTPHSLTWHIQCVWCFLLGALSLVRKWAAHVGESTFMS